MPKVVNQDRRLTAEKSAKVFMYIMDNKDSLNGKRASQIAHIIQTDLGFPVSPSSVNTLGKPIGLEIARKAAPKLTITEYLSKLEERVKFLEEYINNQV